MLNANTFKKYRIIKTCRITCKLVVNCPPYLYRK
jgi:hypothetical protein